MTEAAVHVDGLRKVFDVPEPEAGLRPASKSLVRRKTREVRAVDGISFEIAPGEIVGAGKTTTLKMRSGQTLLLAAGFAAALFGFTRWFWRFGLRSYTGASA